MSNIICITKTIFQDVSEDGSMSYLSHGYRMFDNYGVTYNNMMSLELFEDISNLELARYAQRNGDETSAAMFDHLLEMGEGVVYANGESIGIDKIKGDANA